jgi:hypothetical protein
MRRWWGWAIFCPQSSHVIYVIFAKTQTNKQTNKHEQNSVMSARPQLGTLFRRARQAGGRGYDALDVVCSKQHS